MGADVWLRSASTDPIGTVPAVPDGGGGRSSSHPGAPKRVQAAEVETPVLRIRGGRSPGGRGLEGTIRPGGNHTQQRHVHGHVHGSSMEVGRLLSSNGASI